MRVLYRFAERYATVPHTCKSVLCVHAKIVARAIVNFAFHTDIHSCPQL